MRKVISTITNCTVRVGDKVTLPGNLPATVSGLASRHVVLTAEDWEVRMDFRDIGLEWREGVDPASLMTNDDWLHASISMKEAGGGFASALALAYQRADHSNAQPILDNYGHLFFTFLSAERQKQLRGAA
jgi:hypothetical protein